MLSGGIGAVIALGIDGLMTHVPTTRSSSSDENTGNQRADRKVLQEPLLQFGEINIKHHDDEQEQHRNGADIDDDQDHCQEFRAEQNEKAGRIDECQNKEQHRMHGVLGGDHHERRTDACRGEHIKEYGGDNHS